MENTYEQRRRDETLVQQKSTGHSINSNIFQSVLSASGVTGAKLCTFQYKIQREVCLIVSTDRSLRGQLAVYAYRWQVREHPAALHGGDVP